MATQSSQAGTQARSAWWFFALAFAISWGIWLPALLLPQTSSGLSPLVFVGGFGPFIAAILVTWRAEGKAGLMRWLRQTFRWRISVLWYLAGALLLPIGMALLHYALYRLWGGRSDFAGAPPWYVYLPSVLATTLVSGGNEEPGWRGCALPKLLTKYHPLVANVIIGALWVAWHFPLYFSAGWGGGQQPLLWFLLYAIGLSIIMTWLYAKSRRSVLPVMLLHGATNVVFAYVPMKTVIISSLAYDFNVLKTIVYWAIAIAIIVATRGRLGVKTRAVRDGASVQPSRAPMATTH